MEWFKAFYDFANDNLYNEAVQLNCLPINKIDIDSEENRESLKNVVLETIEDMRAYCSLLVTYNGVPKPTNEKSIQVYNIRDDLFKEAIARPISSQKVINIVPAAVKHCTYIIDSRVQSYKEVWDPFSQELVEKLKEGIANLLDENKTHLNKFDIPTKAKETTSKIKYVTGTACVGKSTLMRRINHECGLKIVKRGYLGGFEAKSHEPGAADGLMLALQNTLSNENTIGDRGMFDNTAWRLIMHLLDYKLIITNKNKKLSYRELDVDGIIKLARNFFGAVYSPFSIEELKKHTVLVIIDPYPKWNKIRMYNRGTKGDKHRSTILNYVVAQNIVYYIYAMLLDHFILYAPYQKVEDKCIFTPNEFPFETICMYFDIKNIEACADREDAMCKPSNKRKWIATIPSTKEELAKYNYDELCYMRSFILDQKQHIDMLEIINELIENNEQHIVVKTHTLNPLSFNVSTQYGIFK